jgi:RpiR family carbohydrate utilization transcriptional regulator
MPKKHSTSQNHAVPVGKLTRQIAKLSPRRQEIVRPVLENPREFVLLSVRAAAQRLGTDPATTVRIVQQLGFDGYRSFQNYLHDLSIANATSLEGMQASAAKDGSIPSHIRDCLDQDLKNLAALRNSLDPSRITLLAKRIHSARRILILGGDFAANLVHYLEYQMTLLGLPVLIATTTGQTMHVTRSLGRKDLVIAISFRRGLRQTVEGLQIARQNGAYCVGITDTYISPIAQFTDEFFLSSVESGSFTASYVAPIALANVILVACGNFDRKRTLNFLRPIAEEQRHGFRWYEV